MCLERTRDPRTPAALQGSQALEETVIQSRRYYPGGTARPVEQMVKHRDAASIAAWVGKNAELGLHLTILMPVVPDLAHVARLALAVLPDYR